MTDASTTIQDLMNIIARFRDERGWKDAHDLKDYPLGLVLESAEVLELFQWMSGDEVEKNSKLHASIGEELSDVLYWVLSLAGRLNIDVSSAFVKKLEKQAKKYPLEQFGKDVSQEERRKHYYKLKAQTRGGHPLHEHDTDA